MSDEENEKINNVLVSQHEPTEEERRYLGRHLLFAVAGFVAEQSAGTTSQESTGSDRRNAMLTAGRLSGGRLVGDRVTGRMDVPDDRKQGFFQVLSEAEEEVKKLLAEHEGAWDGLAGRLMFDGSLTGEQIDQFLTGVLGKREG